MAKRLPAGITMRERMLKGRKVREYRVRLQDRSRRTSGGNYAQISSAWLPTLGAAQAWLEERAAETQRHGSALIDRQMTVGEACEGWFQAATTIGLNGKPPLEAATAQRYRSTIQNDITGRIDGLRIATLKASHVKRWAEQLASDKTNDAAHRALAVLRLALAYQITLDAIGHNPASAVKISKRGKAKGDEDDEGTVERFMEVATVSRILATADLMASADGLPGEGRGYGQYQRDQRREAWRRWRVLVYFLIGTGVRIGEAAALRWSNVDLEAATVRITHALKRDNTIGVPKTRTSVRTITLGSGLVELLRDLKGEAGPAAFVFGQGDAPMRPDLFARRNWLPMMQLAGLVDSAGLALWGRHDCRHYHASLLIRSGVPPQQVAERLGHANTTVTLQVYAHLFRDLAGAGNTAGASLEDALFGKGGD